MEEMVAATQNLTKRFGQVVELHTGESFLDCVDREEKRVTVVVLVHEPSVEGCTAMAGCIECLAQQFPTVKFCKEQNGIPMDLRWVRVILTESQIK